MEVDSIEAVKELIEGGRLSSGNRLILGGGSNILLTKDFDGLAVKVAMAGIGTVDETPTHFRLRIGAGENWHQFVLSCVQNGYAGVENLSLIPGNVGAAPMQNIGAYGVELREVFHSLEAVDLETGEVSEFSNRDCEFGYRTSVFNTKQKGRFLITSVTLDLAKEPQFNTSYGAIEQELERMKVAGLSIGAISEAVCNIRNRKLPDPAQIGNAGSFFKNPVISTQRFEQLQGSHPQIVGYPADNGHTKVAAGWLIEAAGWKGRTCGNYGVHRNQALVLVNYGGAQGSEIYDLSQEILEDIEERFGIALEREVNVV